MKIGNNAVIGAGSVVTKDIPDNVCAAGTPPYDYPFYWALGEKFDPYQFDFDRDFEAVHTALSGYMDANDPDLTRFLPEAESL